MAWWYNMYLLKCTIKLTVHCIHQITKYLPVTATLHDLSGNNI